MTNADDALSIHAIRAPDHDAILALNEHSVEVLSPLDAAGLVALIDQCALAVTAEQDGRVAGFMLVLAEGAHYASENYRWFCERYPRFWYVDRVVVGADYRGRGVADRLYAHLADEAERRGPAVILAEISMQPPNPASMRFHEKWGFREVGRLSHGAGRLLSMQERARP